MRLDFSLMGRSLIAACAATALAADIPIHEVVLYKSGVGYFERGGVLRAGEAARLDFKATDMNDVLKSLTISEQNGGKVTGLRYDSSEPLDQKLAQFPFKVNGQASLALFLDQMRGAKVEVKYGAETISATVVSGRLVKGDDKQPEREQLVALLDSGELRTLDLAAASSIRFADPVLQAQLRDYLMVVNQSRSTDKRSIYIDSSDAKERQIAAGYMLPTPVWKSSYRLIFNDKTEPTLEGWAIVDNTTGEDWSNVRLAVVSGRPVSFISNLYEPKYVARQTVELPEDRAAAPVLYGGAVDELKKAPVALASPATAPMAKAMGSIAGLNRPAAQSFPRGSATGRLQQHARDQRRYSRLGRTIRVSLRDASDGEERRIGHVSVPAAADWFAQTADLFGKLWRTSDERGRTHQFNGQDVGWRSDHRLRCGELCRRSIGEYAEGGRQAIDQLRRRFRDAGDDQVRLEPRDGARDPRESRDADDARGHG